MSRSVARLVACSVALTTVFLVTPATAKAQSPERVGAAAPVLLDAVIGEALRVSPEIAAAEHRYHAAQQRPVQSRSLPDPMVSAGYSAVGKPFPGAGLGTEPLANIGVMVTQPLPYPGKREVQGTLAARDADAERPQISVARLSVIARVKQAYYRLAYAYAASDVLVRNRDLLDTLLKVSENRYAVGQAAQQDVIKAQTQLSILELQLERLRQERTTSEGQLNALLARPSGTAVGRPQDLALPPFDLDLAQLQQATVAHSPMLEREQIMVARGDVAIQAARLDYKPDFALSGGYYSMGRKPSMYEFRLDITVPLQRARRAAAVIEQQQLAELSRRSFQTTRLTLQARIEEDFQMATSAHRLAVLYRDAVLPQARLGLESSLASYQTGGVDFLSVLTNFGTVLEYEMTYFDELAAFHTAVSRLEEMTGQPVAH